VFARLRKTEGVIQKWIRRNFNRFFSIFSGLLAIVILKRKNEYLASLPAGKWIFGGVFVLVGAVLVGWIPGSALPWLLGAYAAGGLLYLPLYRAAFK